MSSPMSDCDHLSDMPGDILEHILSFLPTPDSVRTSVLSSRWRHLWRCVPAFHFDVKAIPGGDKVYKPESEASEAAEKINQFIARRDAACPLFRFHLHITYDFYHLADPISDWISYARSHGVRDMSVHTFYVSNPPPLSTFFDLPSVEALDIQNFNHIMPSMFPQHIAASKLKALTLHLPCASFADKCFAALRCYPNLQELTLYRGQLDEVVEITAPNLRRLTIVDDDCYSDRDSYQVKISCARLEYLHLHLSSWAYLKRFQGKLTSLREASMDLSYSSPKITKQFTQSFMSLRSVTTLTLRLMTDIEVKDNPWCLLKHMTRFPIFCKLKRLKFSADISEDYIKQVLLCFVVHSPNLSSLQVIDESEYYWPFTSNTWKQQFRIPASLKALDHLKIVSVKEIWDEQIQSDVLKMLSKHVNEWERVLVII